jgi:excisionase family DNA binding protein
MVAPIDSTPLDEPATEDTMAVSDDPTIAAAITQGRCRHMAMSVAEAAVEARIGRDGIYEAIRDGRLEARKWGRRTLVTHEALQRFLNGLPPLRLPR